MDWPVVVLVVSFAVLLLLNVPVAFCMGIATVLAFLAMGDMPAFVAVAHNMATGIDSFALLAIPFFILSGLLMGHGGIARRLIDFANVLAGRFRGGLAYVNVVTCMMFGAISGSATAAVSSVGGFMIPLMNKMGYHRDFNTSVTITAATTGLLIPPSNIMIVYSLATGGFVSIAGVFMAGYLPGILVGLSLMLVAGIISVKHKYGQGQGVGLAVLLRAFLRVVPVLLLAAIVYVCTSYAFPAAVTHIMRLLLVCVMTVWTAREIRHNRISAFLLCIGIGTLAGWFVASLARVNWGIWTAISLTVLGAVLCFRPSREACRFFLRAIPALLLIFIVIGGILLGWFTPTEASAVAVLYSFFLAVVVYREVKLRDLPAILLQCGVTTAVVFLLIATSMAMSWVLASENVPQNISASLVSLTDNKVVLLLLINAILLVVGTFMDMTPAILIFTPIFLPIVEKLGVHPLHFGIIMIMNLCIGLCTPPVGTCLFLGCGIGETTVTRVIRHIVPFFAAMIIALLITTFVPQLSMYIPEKLGFVK